MRSIRYFNGQKLGCFLVWLIGNTTASEVGIIQRCMCVCYLTDVHFPVIFLNKNTWDVKKCEAIRSNITNR